MNDAIACRNVVANNFSTIDEELAVLDFEGHLLALKGSGLESIRHVSRQDFAGQYVVFQDVRQLTSPQQVVFRQIVAGEQGVESCIGRRKDSEGAAAGQGFIQPGGGQRVQQNGELPRILGHIHDRTRCTGAACTSPSGGRRWFGGRDRAGAC